MWPVIPIFELGWAIPVKSHVWKFGSDWLSLSRVIICIFRWGRNPLLGGLYVTCDAHFRTLSSYSSQKAWAKIGSDWLSLSRAIMSTNVWRGGGGGGAETPIWGGRLHLTCDAHFRTRMCYSFQKSYVKIWFGLAEIGGMLSLRGAEDPLLGGLTCELRCPFSNLPELFYIKVMCENLVRIAWVFQELLCPQTKKKKKKKKSQTQLKTIYVFFSHV